MKRPTNLALASILSFGLVACGGGGGGGAGGEAQPVPAGQFAGTWEITTTLKADASLQSKQLVTMTVNGLDVEAKDGQPGALTGKIRGLALTLKRGTDTTVELLLASVAADTLSGTGVFPGGQDVLIAGKRQVGPTPTPDFAGTWDVTATSDADPSKVTTLRLVIEMNGEKATAFDGEAEPLKGVLQGARLLLNRAPETKIVLSIGANADQLVGEGSFPSGDVTIVATRNKGQSIALQTGRWTFELQDPNSSPLFFNDGTLTQDGAKVRFVFSEARVSQTFEGTVDGQKWSPEVTGTVSFEFTGEFRADGKGFTGTYTSRILGNGTITGSAEQ